MNQLGCPEGLHLGWLLGIGYSFQPALDKPVPHHRLLSLIFLLLGRRSAPSIHVQGHQSWGGGGGGQYNRCEFLALFFGVLRGSRLRERNQRFVGVVFKGDQFVESAYGIVVDPVGLLVGLCLVGGDLAKCRVEKLGDMRSHFRAVPNDHLKQLSMSSRVYLFIDRLRDLFHNVIANHFAPIPTVSIPQSLRVGDAALGFVVPGGAEGGGRQFL
jgi:hypothetical protein